MTRPLTIEELDEVLNLEAECERPERLRALLAELLRLRTLARVCRNHAGRLPRAVQQTLDNSVPKRSSGADWARAAAEGRIDADPRHDGASPRLL